MKAKIFYAETNTDNTSRITHYELHFTPVKSGTLWLRQFHRINLSPHTLHFTPHV